MNDPTRPSSYAQLQPDLPGLGRASTRRRLAAPRPSSRFTWLRIYSSSETTSTPLSTLSRAAAGHLVLLGDDTSRNVVGPDRLNIPGSPGRLNVFLGSPDTLESPSNWSKELALDPGADSAGRAALISLSWSSAIARRLCPGLLMG